MYVRTYVLSWVERWARCAKLNTRKWVSCLARRASDIVLCVGAQCRSGAQDSTIGKPVKPAYVRRLLY